MKFLNGKIFYKGKIIKKDFAIIDNCITFKNLKNIKNAKDIKGMVVSPGFVDVHIHTRVPGFEYKEDLQHITNALIYGGFTHAVAQSNTNPMPNNIETLKNIQKMLDTSEVNIIQAGRITKNNKVIDIEKMSKYTRLFTDDGEPIKSKYGMLQAIKLAKKTDSTLILHEQDYSIKGHMYHCKLATTKNIESFGEEYESNIVKRDIELNQNLNAKLHFQHISTKQSIDLIKNAKLKGMNVTAEVTPHHLILDNENIINDGKFKMNPPLASLKTKKYLVKALKDKDITIIATDHAPHSKEEKEGGFTKAVNGIIGLETSFAVVNTVAKQNQISLETIIEAMSINPGKLMGINTRIYEGKIANLVFLDENEKWIFGIQDIKSKSNNTPFIDKIFTGKVKALVLNGKYRELL